MRLILLSYTINLLFTLIFSLKQAKEKCYVIALEGGGDKGSYQVGALKGLVDNVPNNETKWDVVTGISVGSLNAAGLSIHDIGNEEEAVNFLLDHWRNIKGKSDIYQNWWLGPLYGLLYKNSLYDTSPTKKLLAEIISTSTLKRQFVIGATDVESGAFTTWDEQTLNRDEYIQAIMSSGGYPVFFPNIQFRNRTYMDGGVKVSMDVFSGINKCLDNGYTEENIVVDAILLSSKNITDVKPKDLKTMQVLIRVFEVFGYDNAMRDLEDTLEMFPKVNYRYIIEPTEKLPSGEIPLTFSPEQIEKMIKIGINDAINVIKKGEGKNLKEMLVRYKQERRERMTKRFGKQKNEYQKSETAENLNLDELDFLN
jgi:predicted patatin/cPLA2 family phospholipase